jgi:hypothetical protein
MRKLLLLYTLLLFQVAAFAQERTYLPYSVFGLGEINSKGFVRNMAMGRSGIALSSDRYLNNINPASYYGIDSISFFLDFGIGSDFVKYRTATNSVQHGNDVNIRNIAIGFRISHNWAASIGVAPYSTVGYKIVTEKYIEGPDETFLAVLTGNGGLNQFYWNNSYLLFKRLSLGVNFTYLFGSIESTETVIFDRFLNDIISKQTSYLNKIYADFGVQYFFPINKDLKITLGGVFGNSHKLNFKNQIVIAESDGTIVKDEIIRRGTFDFPLYAGGGIAVLFKDKFTLTADYLFHNWSNTKSENPDFSYHNNNTFKVGIELVPGNYKQLGYFGSIRCRAGYYHEESYLKIGNDAFSDNGFTLGLGLPFLQNKTSINIAYNVGINGTMNNGLIKENYNSFFLSLTLHDWWFIKRKFD